MKEERRARFMAVQERISAARLKRKVGKTLTVLVDEVDDEGAIARSAADAPEIDGVVHVARVEEAEARRVRAGARHALGRARPSTLPRS